LTGYIVFVTRVLPILIIVAMTIFTLVTVVQSPREQVRHLPRWLWFVVVLTLPIIGLATWWLTGRPLNQPSADAGPVSRPIRPVAPDDDPDFLRSLGGSG